MAQRLNIDIVARDKSKQALNSLKGRLGKLKASVFNLRNAFIGLGAGLVIRNIVNTGKQLEGLQVRLKFLFGSAEEGAKAFDKMAKFASKVPFSLEEIQQGSGNLAVVAKDADHLAHLMKITGNVAAATGLDFRTTAEQIQRSMSAGISAADLFRDRGVKAMLGFKAGATASIEETVVAFDRVFGDGGKYGKTTEALAKTFEGTLSMIGDKVFNFKRVLLEAGFFDELKKQFGDLNKFLEDNAKEIDKIATAVGEKLAQGIVGAVKIGKDLVPTLKKIGKALKGMIDGFNALPDFVKDVGLIGAVLFGKKGVVALAGISFIMDKITDFVNDTKIKAGIFDLDNVEHVKKRLEEITKEQGRIFRAMTEGLDVNDKLIGFNQEYLDLLEKEKKELNLILLNSKKTLSLLEEKNKKRLEFQKLELGEVKTSKEKIDTIEKEYKALFDYGKLKDLIAKKDQFILVEKNKKRLEFNELVNQGVKAFEKENDLAGNLLEKIKDQNAQWSLSDEILTVVNNGVQGFSRMLAESVVYGKKINASFKELAKGLLVDILAKMIERIALVMIEEFILSKIIKKDKDKLAVEKDITREKQKQLALQAAIVTLGGGGGGIPFFQHCGAVSKGKPIVVGERGPELFVPNTSGQIQQNARGTGGGPVNVNFSITALDASGFSEMLIQNRGTISHIINQAVNERGASNIV